MRVEGWLRLGALRRGAHPTKRLVCQAVLLAAALTILSHEAAAVGSNLTGAGGFMTAPSPATGARERVSLRAEAGVLVGRAQHDLIHSIVIDAPDIEQGEVLVRDLTSRDGSRSLLITAAPALHEKMRHALLFVSAPSEGLLLAEQRAGGWNILRPELGHTTPVASRERDGKDLLAFRLSNFGSYRVVDREAVLPPAALTPVPDSSPSQIIGGGFSKAILPLMAGIVVLGLGWMISVLIHRTQKSKGD